LAKLRQGKLARTVKRTEPGMTLIVINKDTQITGIFAQKQVLAQLFKVFV
jgi:hypothetical protein